MTEGPAPGHGTIAPLVPRSKGRSDTLDPGPEVGGRRTEFNDTKRGIGVVCALANAARPVPAKAPFRIASGRSEMARKTSQKGAMECHLVPFVHDALFQARRPYRNPNNAGFEPGYGWQRRHPQGLGPYSSCEQKLRKEHPGPLAVILGSNGSKRIHVVVSRLDLWTVGMTLG
jgi:hypothetical protein